MTFKQVGMALIGAVIVIGVGTFGYWLGRPAATDSDSPATPVPQESQSPETIGRWELQAQFVGPLKDTVVQRWRDPKTGVLCYIYLPIVVQHLAPLQNGIVHYGANGTGSISCVVPKTAAPA